MRDGGSYRFVCGDLFDGTVEPGPYDLILSWRAIQGFSDSEMEVIARGLTARLTHSGLIWITVQNDPTAWETLVRIFVGLGYEVNAEPRRTVGRTALIFVASG